MSCQLDKMIIILDGPKINKVDNEPSIIRTRSGHVPFQPCMLFCHSISIGASFQIGGRSQWDGRERRRGEERDACETRNFLLNTKLRTACYKLGEF